MFVGVGAFDNPLASAERTRDVEDAVPYKSYIDADLYALQSEWQSALDILSVAKNLIYYLNLGFI